MCTQFYVEQKYVKIHRSLNYKVYINQAVNIAKAHDIGSG